MVWAFSHVPARVHNTREKRAQWSTKRRRQGGQEQGRRRIGRRAADTCMCLRSFISGGHLNYIYWLSMRNENRERKVVVVVVVGGVAGVCRETHSDEDRGESCVQTGS